MKMDESGEILLNPNTLEVEESDDDVTIPLENIVNEEVDSAQPMVNENLHLQTLLTEIRKFKDEYREQLRTITHDFLNYQKRGD